MSTLPKIKPCPWCGVLGKYVSEVYLHQIECPNEDCPARPHVAIFHEGHGKHSGTKNEVIERWNNRAEVSTR